MFACLIWAIPVGIALGTIAAVNRGRFLDRLVIAISVAGVSTPVFFIGLILMQYVGYQWELLPFIGRGGPLWSLDGLASIALPALTLGLIFIGPIARMTRTAALEVMNADHVRTARAKGLAERTVILQACAAQRADPGGDADRPAGRLSARRRRRHRDDLLLARRRPAGGRRHPRQRFPAGPGRDPGAGAGLPDDQPDRRHALRRARSAGAETWLTSPPRRARVPPAAALASPLAAPHPRDKLALAAAVILLRRSALAALLAPWLAPFDPYNTTRRPFLPPIWSEGSLPQYWLGTDGQGRDMLSRLLYGTRLTLVMGLASVILGGGLGALVGLLSAYYRRLDP